MCGDTVGVTVDPLVGACWAVVAAAKGVVIAVGVGWTSGCETGAACAIGTWKREKGWFCCGSTFVSITSSGSAAAKGRCPVDDTSYRFRGPCVGVGGAGRFSPLWPLASASMASCSHSGLPPSFVCRT